ncbi:MAG: hypothetical protein A2018_00295 [Alphaproteobacteria bacterium GWF2_58_20]|nr:MAG: hypothetical protein A2018_00295 [Alphaproteobacteria bacterium GWF2_58_20]
MAEKKGLGKGLSALLGEAGASYDHSLNMPVRAPVAGHVLVSVEHLRAGAFQPRQVFDEDAIAMLAESIRERGVLQPIIVRHDGLSHPEGGHRYEIIAGERRWRAARKAGLRDVPVIVKELDDRAAMEIALVENLQRQDLSAFEEAEAFQRLMGEFSYTQEQLARAVGRSRSVVANTLRLLSLPDEVRKLVESGQLSAGHARTLVGVENPVALAREMVEEGLNVRQAEAVAGQRRPKTRTSGTPAMRNDDVDALADGLSERLGAEVALRVGRAGSGKIIISFKNLAQFDTILDRMTLGIRAGGSHE